MRGTGRSGRLALGAGSAGLAAVSGCNPVHPGSIHLLRSKLELEALDAFRNGVAIPTTVLSTGCLQLTMVTTLGCSTSRNR
jgi:hypothetical protein